MSPLRRASKARASSASSCLGVEVDRLEEGRLGPVAIPRRLGDQAEQEVRRALAPPSRIAPSTSPVASS